MIPTSVWIIVPFSREKFFDNLMDNINRQTFNNLKVCIVENGDGIGVCKKRNYTPDLLLTSEYHQCIAKNLALEEIRKLGGGYTTIFDDDDYYGPNYIQEVVDHANVSEVVGKLGIIAKLTDDRMVVIHNTMIYKGFVPYIQAATISCWAEDAAEYSTDGKLAEETKWTRTMALRGARIFATSIYNFCYMRHAAHNHTFAPSDQAFMDKGAILINNNFDSNIINGITPQEYLKKTENYRMKFPNAWYKDLIQKNKFEGHKHLGLLSRPDLFNK